MVRLWIVLPLLAGCPRQPSGPDLDRAQAEAVARTFVGELAARDFDRARGRFDATMKRSLSRDQLAKIWHGTLERFGDFDQVTSVRTDRKQSLVAAILTTRFARAELDLRVVLTPSKQVTGFWIKPARGSKTTAAKFPPPPYASKPEERAVTTGVKGLPLPGKLSLPRRGRSLPAVVLVHGSGPNDMDETVGANKPFRDLAWGLAARGVATLRYQKRTRQFPEKFGSNKRYTIDQEVVDDARAAVALLARTPRIDSKRIFVVGHSLGGMLAPRIARDEPRLAGIVILAGPTRPLEVLIVEQTRRLAPDKLREMEAFARRVQDPALKPDDTVMILGQTTSASYWLDLRGYDPARTAAALRRPILVLHGGRDYQVEVVDFEGWKRALAGRSDVRLRLFPNLNHLFITGKGPSTPAEYQRPGHVAQEVVAEIATFLGGGR